MRKILLLLLVVGVLGLPHEAIGQQYQDGRAKDLVAVHAEVLRQSYCHVDDESFSAFLDLNLRFVNSSDRPVILSRKIESPIVRVAKDLDAASKRDFVFALYPDFFPSEVPNAPTFGDVPDPKLFVVLAPGENFETVAQTVVIGANDAGKDGKGGLLAKGSYVLDVGIYAWPYQWPWFSSNAKPEELTRRWSKYGKLATGLVYSDFAPFTLPEHFKNPRCPLPSRRRAKSR